jgi:hypothetical protein
MEERRGVYRFRRGNLRKDPGVHGKKILRWIFGKCNGWT